MTDNVTPKFAVWTCKLNNVNGQNIVTQRVIKHQSSQISRVYDYPIGGGNSIPVAIWSAFKLCFAVLTGRHTGIYLVCSRSSSGFIRDMLPLSMSLLGHRVVVHVHGSDFPQLFERRILGNFARLLYAKCEIVLPSMHIRSDIKGVAFKRLHFCENFANSLDTNYERQNFLQSVNSFVVLWNSNLMASKGIKELVSGLRILRDEGLSVELVILGAPVKDDEATVDDIERLISTLHSDPWVHVVGRVLPEQVGRYLAVCNAVALPSTYASECQPLSIIQAMLAGRIVLVAPTDALRATVGTYPAIFADRDAVTIANVFRGHVKGDVEPDKGLNQEVNVARNRFAPEAFDLRIGQILANQNKEK